MQANPHTRVLETEDSAHLCIRPPILLTTHAFVYVCICVYVCIHIYIYIYTHTCAYIYTYVLRVLARDGGAPVLI